MAGHYGGGKIEITFVFETKIERNGSLIVRQHVSVPFSIFFFLKGD